MTRLHISVLAVAAVVVGPVILTLILNRVVSPIATKWLGWLAVALVVGITPAAIAAAAVNNASQDTGTALAMVALALTFAVGGTCSQLDTTSSRTFQPALASGAGTYYDHEEEE